MRIQAQNPIKSINLREVSDISDVLPTEVSQREHVFRYIILINDQTII